MQLAITSITISVYIVLLVLCVVPGDLLFGVEGGARVVRVLDSENAVSPPALDESVPLVDKHLLLLRLSRLPDLLFELQLLNEALFGPFQGTCVVRVQLLLNLRLVVTKSRYFLALFIVQRRLATQLLLQGLSLQQRGRTVVLIDVDALLSHVFPVNRGEAAALSDHLRIHSARTPLVLALCQLYSARRPAHCILCLQKFVQMLGVERVGSQFEISHILEDTLRLSATCCRLFVETFGGEVCRS